MPAQLQIQSLLSQIVDLDDPSTMPEGWSSEIAPESDNYQHPTDMSVYELHIRDFSASDPEVPPEHRGKYAAFGQNGLGARHLADLQKAGLTHVHLLPSYDFGSVPERSEDQLQPEVCMVWGYFACAIILLWLKKHPCLFCKDSTLNRQAVFAFKS